MPPAARVDDPHVCNFNTPQEHHVGGPIEGPGSTTVRTAFRAQARAGDRCRCDGPADFVVTGSRSVLIDGRPAARKGDRTLHQPAGAITEGARSVDIGGPAVGVVLGGDATGRQACADAAAGRFDNSPAQSFGNCGLESVRQIINRANGTSVSEGALLNDALEHGCARNNPDPVHLGGSNPYDDVETLARYGVSATTEQAITIERLAQLAGERRGVITPHDVAVLWDPSHTGGHAVTVIGVRFDAEGAPESVIYNDTGTGTCHSEMPVERFMRSLQPGAPMVVTRDAIW